MMPFIIYTKGWYDVPMLNYIEFLQIPSNLALVLVALFLCMQIVGELLEFKGKVVPEFIKIRKYFTRKKKERETINAIPQTLANVEALLNDVNQHYNTDNITMRNKWMDWVNNQAHVYDMSIAELEKKMDQNNSITLTLLIESKRNTIINFASKVIDDNFPVTREQFNRVFKIYKEYEEIIKEHQMTNGEVDIAIRIINEAYEKHMKDHTFIEDIRGYYN